MYWVLHGHDQNHPQACLSRADAKAFEVFKRVPAHAAFEGLFIADDFAPDSLAFVDLVESVTGDLVVTEAFRTFAMDAFPEAFAFAPCLLRWGGRDVLQWVGDEVGSFHIARPLRRAAIINRSLRPMQFWPKLKRFKSEDFVIDKRTDAVVFTDPEGGRRMIVDERFRTAAEASGLKVSFGELPCVPGLAETTSPDVSATGGPDQR